MKFRINEDMYDDFRVTMEDADVSEKEVVTRYIKEVLGLDKAKEIWLDQVYPYLNDEYKKTVATYDSVDEYLEDFPADEYAEDFIDYEVYEYDEIEDMFYDLFEDEIADVYDAIEDHKDYVYMVSHDY